FHDPATTQIATLSLHDALPISMLGVIGERFPKAGAIAMGISGGMGMLSAGFLGGPGIGYTQDYHAKSQLQAVAPAAYDRVKAERSEEHTSELQSLRHLVCRLLL